MLYDINVKNSSVHLTITTITKNKTLFFKLNYVFWHLGANLGEDGMKGIYSDVYTYLPILYFIE